MKNLRLIPVTAVIASLVLAPAAFAAKGDGPKAKAMAKYDLNHDGKLDDAEAAALQKDFAADPKGDLSRFDTDHDGKLSADELAKVVPGSGKKGEKSEKKADGEKKHEAKKAGDKKADDKSAEAAK